MLLYTNYSLIFSNSLNILTFVIITLSLLSSFLNIIIIKNYYSVNSIKENSLYIIMNSMYNQVHIYH